MDLGIAAAVSTTVGGRNSEGITGSGLSPLPSLINAQKALVERTTALLRDQQQYLDVLQGALGSEGDVDRIAAPVKRLVDSWHRSNTKSIDDTMEEYQMRLQRRATELPRKVTIKSQSSVSAGASDAATSKSVTLADDDGAPDAVSDSESEIDSDLSDPNDGGTQEDMLKLKMREKVSTMHAAVMFRSALAHDSKIVERAFRAWTVAVRPERLQAGMDILDKFDEDEADLIGVPGKPTKKALQSTTPPGILHPQGSKRVCIDLSGMCLIFYDMIVIPVILAFSDAGNPARTANEPFWLQEMTRWFWSIECVMSFHTAYYDPDGNLIINRAKIYLNHFKTWFIVDVMTVGVEWIEILVLAILEIDRTQDGQSGAPGANSLGLLRFFRIARMIRMLRLLRVLKLKKFITTFYDAVLQYAEWVQLVLQIVKLNTFILFLVHYVGCAWYAFSVSIEPHMGSTWVQYYFPHCTDDLPDYDPGEINILNRDQVGCDDSIGYMYTTALHWALTQVSPGTMEVMPRNWAERAFNIVVLLVTLVVFSSFISSMTIAVTRLRATIGGVDERRFAILRKYLRDHKIPSDLGARIVACIEARTAALSVRTQEHEVDLLPMLTRGLQMDLRSAKLEPTLRNFPLFRQLLQSHEHPQLMNKVCMDASSMIPLAPRENAFYIGHEAMGMYFLAMGQFELREMHNDADEKYIIGPKKPPDGYCVKWLCEFALLMPLTHTSTLSSLWYAELIHINRRLFLQIINMYPKAEEVLLDENAKRFERCTTLLGEDWVRDWVRVKVDKKGKAAKRFSLQGFAGEISGVVANMVHRHPSKEEHHPPPSSSQMQQGRSDAVYVNGETFSAGRHASDNRHGVHVELTDSKILI
jgi:hypothetical protein